MEASGDDCQAWTQAQGSVSCRHKSAQARMVMNPQDPQPPLWRTLLSRRPSFSVAATVLGLAAALASIPFINDFFASPEEALFKMGYKKNYSEFVQAIVNKHPQAVGLFCKSGMRLKPDDVRLVFDDKHYSAKTVDALTSGGCMDSNQCPTALPEMGIYLGAAGHPDKRRDLRALCGNVSVVNAIESNIEAERVKLQASAAKNAGRQERIRACVGGFMAEPSESLLSEAAQFNMLGTLTYTLRQCVLADLKAFLMIRPLGGGPASQAVQAAAVECCGHADPMVPVSTAGMAQAQQALDFLR